MRTHITETTAGNCTLPESSRVVWQSLQRCNHSNTEVGKIDRVVNIKLGLYGNATQAGICTTCTRRSANRRWITSARTEGGINI